MAILEDLIARRRLSAADGENLLSLRRQQGQRLGRLLVTAGVLSQEGLRDALAERLGLSRWEPPQNLDDLDADAAALLPPAFLRFNAVLPVSADEGVIRLAMAWPPDESLIETVRQTTGREVEALASTQREVEGALDRALAGREGGSGEDGADVLLLDADRLRDLASEAPVVQFLTAAIERAVSLGASDIHLERGERSTRLRVRVDGELLDLDAPPAPLYAGLVSRIKIMARLDVGERRLPQDGRVQLQTSGRQIDVRVSILPSMHGEDVVLRILDRGSVQLDLDELGLSRRQREGFRRLIRRPEGMVLLTGPTGSGKTTTLYSGLKEVARPNVKVVTVEDPVEYHLDGVNQIQVRTEIGLDFARCLRSILRHDPDIIMVGEIRDRETAAMAVQSSLTGHLVLSTLHTNSAAAAFPRLLDMGVEDYLIASAVVGIMAQRLVRRICPDCVEAYDPDTALLERHRLAPGTKFHRGAGCRACLNTGYRGRTVVGELLVVDEPVHRAILDRRGAADIHRIAREECEMQSLWDHAVEKVCEGETSYEQIIENIQE
ncbi:MAG: Flp pilus assembly complex ATPase component TadA [Phycisphaerales bacterium]|nr:Flp pilus assembly complex ATPase component TadA [Phycisphaerales bacterium]